MAAELASDPERAHSYALAARKLAGNVGIVREVAGIAAYRTGRWAEALAELRAAREMTRRNDYLAVMADSERALGRPDRALELLHSPEARRLLLAAGRAGQARRAFGKAIEFDPEGETDALERLEEISGHDPNRHP